MSDASPFRNAWKNVRASFAIAGVQIVCALMLAFAANRGMIGTETVMRGGMVICGLGLAAVGNRLPKSPDGMPPHTLELAALRQSALRTAGWAMMVGGLAFSGIWVFAPLDVAAVSSTITLGASIIVGLGGITWWIFAYHRSPTRWSRHSE